MHRLLFVFFLSFFTVQIRANESTDSLRKELDFTLKSKEGFKLEKLRRINALKDSIKATKGSLNEAYRINNQLIKEYEKFQIDSAISLVRNNVVLAKAINNLDYLNESNLKLAGLFSSAGKYIESQDILNQLNRQSLNTDLLPLYFSTLTEFCSHYGQSSNNASYFKLSEIYRDSLLNVLNESSLRYQLIIATKKLYDNQIDEAEKILKQQLDLTNDTMSERALAGYLLGVIAKNRNDLKSQLHYFSISAITDMRLAITDNASFQSLALAFYENNDIDRAYQYIDEAINDAIFCNVRYRTIESTTFYPLINAAFQEKERKEKLLLISFLSTISLLSILLFGGIIKVNIQKKKLKIVREELFNTNQELKLLNVHLQESNNSLSEASQIKEIYITQFFEICSSYIEKHETYRNGLYKYVLNNDLAHLKKELKRDNFVKSELDELYKNFDVIFLNLYPSFISEFKELLQPDQKIIPDTSEFLNTELRIYALIKLGISDTTKIARFLRCSLQTVYNYRVKVRGNALQSKDEFEKSVLLIGGFQQK
ncbi:DUF6377 domain-containing protein [Sphingobacterium hungaricum]|uniref:DUF6377 domain-containing protein n=1 Tax=Sphingobacterium hungaricum TaxID=2082723 RepID=A0A928UW86_9SPHI|nr:DUF6377 domain-containing protein [Sphingobacterium hungaricum]MBE8714113.1 hypothetical protein [Sphingobacterium hungaricum]